VLQIAPVTDGEERILFETTGDSRVSTFKLTPDDRFVVFRADAETIGVPELYSVSTVGGLPVKLNNTLTTGGIVEEDFLCSPDGRTVIFRASQNSSDVPEIFAAPTNGSGPAVRLNSPLSQGEVLPGFDITNDGTQLVFVERNPERIGILYSVPLDGSSPPVPLTDPLISTNEPLIKLSSDDQFLIVSGVADPEVRNAGLFYVPLDSANPVLPISTLTRGGVLDFVLSPNDTFVVYTEQVLSFDPINLYSRQLPELGATAFTDDPTTLNVLDSRPMTIRFRFPAFGAFQLKEETIRNFTREQ
jgi:dipeptidyl aminopeptidase/acylaminoacyl peptidase